MEYDKRVAETFIAEAEEYLGEIEDVLLDIEQNPEDADGLNRLFRIVHNLKGAGDMFGFEAVTAFTHHLETALESVRDGDVKVDRTLIDLILACRDHVKLILDPSEDVAEFKVAGDLLIERLRGLMPEGMDFVQSDVGGDDQVTSNSASDFETKEYTDYQIILKPASSIFHSGAEPADFLDDVSALGDCEVILDDSGVPALDDLDPEECYLRWEIALTTNASLDDVKDVFIFLGSEEFEIQEREAFSSESLAAAIEKEKMSEVAIDDAEDSGASSVAQAFFGEDDELLVEFVVESKEHLDHIEDDFLQLEEDPDNVDQELVNKVFRAIHSIKGSSGFLNLTNISKLSHAMETLLSMIRNGEAKPESSRVEVLLKGIDALNGMLDDIANSDQFDIVAIHAELEAMIRNSSEAAAAAMDNMVDVPADHGKEAPFMVDEQTFKTLHEKGRYLYHIKVDLIELERDEGMSPRRLVKELVALGNIIDSRALGHDLTLSDSIDDLVFPVEFLYSTIIDPSLIGDAFKISGDQIEEVDENEVTRRPRVGDDVKPPERPEPKAPTKKEVKNDEATTSKAGDGGKSETKRGAMNVVESVRVPLPRLDSLVNLVGEMVISQARLVASVANGDAFSTQAAVEEMDRLIAELRDNALSIRMMPIGGTFAKYKRLTRDLSAKLGKQIAMVTEGGDTELDKTVIDRLADPLVHLVRNSIDHGIETPEERAKAGKPEKGTLTLTASHKGGNVCVTIEDDGKGLDVEAIRSKALERGLIQPGVEMSRHEIFQLIFAPGFSTAKTVTNVSGRGVGMDVVKRQIEALRGTIDIHSETGQGTVITLGLPLTLAIIDGLLVSVAEDRYIVPLSSVTETVEITAEERAADNGRNIVVVRGEQIPYLRLRELFNMPEDDEIQLENVIIVEFEEKKLGVVVDKVLGNHQTVIKSLGKLYKDVDAVSGATIMGDGSIALILDVAGLTRRVDGAAS